MHDLAFHEECHSRELARALVCSEQTKPGLEVACAWVRVYDYLEIGFLQFVDSSL